MVRVLACSAETQPNHTSEPAGMACSVASAGTATTRAAAAAAAAAAATTNVQEAVMFGQVVVARD